MQLSWWLIRIILIALPALIIPLCDYMWLNAHVDSETLHIIAIRSRTI